jgi:shikimate kinase
MKDKGIVLIGMAGVGKSTVGKILAAALEFDFIDPDDYIREKGGRTIQRIIDDEGEESFLRLEKRTMREIDLTGRVVAPGGSIIYHPDLMEFLKQRSTLVYLDDSFENIAAKVAAASTRGIVGLRKKSLREIYEEREPLYAAYADITVDCRDKSLEQIAREILSRYPGR